MGNCTTLPYTTITKKFGMYTVYIHSTTFTPFTVISDGNQAFPIPDTYQRMGDPKNAAHDATWAGKPFSPKMYCTINVDTKLPLCNF